MPASPTPPPPNATRHKAVDVWGVRADPAPAGARPRDSLGGRRRDDRHPDCAQPVHGHRRARPTSASPDLVVPADPGWPAAGTGLLPARRRLADNDDPRYCLTHLRWPDCWTLRQGDTTFLTVGTSVPARGRLVELYIADGAAFFRDSTGAVWPLPLRREPVTPQRIATGITN